MSAEARKREKKRQREREREREKQRGGTRRRANPRHGFKVHASGFANFSIVALRTIKIQNRSESMNVCLLTNLCLLKTREFHSENFISNCCYSTNRTLR